MTPTMTEYQSSLTDRILPVDRFDWSQVSQTGELPPGYRLIQDSRPLEIIEKKVISEDKGPNGNPFTVMRLRGLFQAADKRNANGRVYPFDVLEDAVNQLQEAINGRRVLGEFDHPADAKIHLDRISHLLTKLYMESDGSVYGELEVMNDDRCPCGSMLACLIERGVQVGISSRGVGDMEIKHLDEGGEAYHVQNGYRFVTFDCVAEPSVEGSHLMVMESKQRLLASRNLDMRRQLLANVHDFFVG